MNQSSGAGWKACAPNCPSQQQASRSSKKHHALDRIYGFLRPKTNFHSPTRRTGAACFWFRPGKTGRFRPSVSFSPLNGGEFRCILQPKPLDQSKVPCHLPLGLEDSEGTLPLVALSPESGVSHPSERCDSCLFAST